MKTGNFFGDGIPELREILEDQNIAEFIELSLRYVLGNAGLKYPCEMSRNIVRLARENNQAEYEEKAKEEISMLLTPGLLHSRLRQRSERIFRQVRPYLQNGLALDVGCGDGVVGDLIDRSGLEVVLADVYRHPNIDELKMPFIQFRQGELLPAEKEFYDNALLLTVIHHSDDPNTTVRDAYHVLRPGGKLIVIESVYGVNTEQVEEYSLDPKAQEQTQKFKSLTSEAQRLANIFFDHFYNRVIYDGVNCPFNFNTPEKWNDFFKERGFAVLDTRYLGIDQPVVPEYHTLHVLEKNSR